MIPVNVFIILELVPRLKVPFLLSIVRTFFKENDYEILPAHYTWKVVVKGLKIKCVMWG